MISMSHKQKRVSRRVVDVPHCGRIVPDNWIYYCSDACLRRGEDRYVDLLIDPSLLSAQDCLKGHFSRVYLDLNAAPNDIWLPEWEMFQPLHALRGRGFIWSWCRGSFVNDISTGEYQNRLRYIYQPYIQQLTGMLTNRPIWVQVHAMQSYSSHGEHPEICLGSLNGLSADALWLGQCRHYWRSLGYEVTLNWPFSGGYLLKSYHTMAHRSVQIEFNKSLYLSPNDSPDMAKVERFKKHFNGFVQHLRCWGV